MDKKYKVSYRTNSKNTQEPSTIMVGLVVSAFFLVIPSFILYNFAQPNISAYQSKNWQMYPCKIIDSEVITRKYPREDRKYHNVKILYEYVINDVKYQSEQCGFGSYSHFSDYEEASDIVRQYPSQKQTVCYVNPANPKDAVLTRELSMLPLLVVIGLTGPFILFGLVALLATAYNIIKFSK